ncbi:alpha/beta hydrolase [Nocardioides speluncae]|uniref:alpha/beta hydrolase n=1 Tax=Nocardioides speluncae TaxID=2670337 RepID=UPI000D692B8F|nr:alpha/beta hydrolase [Nocardioides speluncae]
MERRPRLLTTHAPRSPHGVVVVLHGGGSRRDNPMVSPAQLSVVRMVPIARRIARAGDGRLAVFRLLNTHRGWDRDHTPVMDVRWALAQLRDRYPDVPCCLVGHSLGGRAALLAGGEPGVRGIVALNAWVYPTDDADLHGRRVLLVHGTEDRVASLRNVGAMAQRLSAVADVTFTTVDGGKHAMLRHGSQFEQLAADFAVATLLG